MGTLNGEGKAWDGLQRISTILDFYAGKFELCNTLFNAVKKRKLSQFSFETASVFMIRLCNFAFTAGINQEL
jgi:hypothetical protein